MIYVIEKQSASSDATCSTYETTDDFCAAMESRIASSGRDVPLDRFTAALALGKDSNFDFWYYADEIEVNRALRVGMPHAFTLPPNFKYIETQDDKSAAARFVAEVTADPRVTQIEFVGISRFGKRDYEVVINDTINGNLSGRYSESKIKDAMRETHAQHQDRLAKICIDGERPEREKEERLQKLHTLGISLKELAIAVNRMFVGRSISDRQHEIVETYMQVVLSDRERHNMPLKLDLYFPSN